MSCTSGRPEFWAELVSAYHDGELSADQAAEVERHLAGCQACAEWLEHLRSDQAEMVAAGMAPGQSDRRPLPNIAGRLSRWTFLRRPAWIGAAGAVSVLAVLIAATLIPRARRPGSAPAGNAVEETRNNNLPLATAPRAGVTDTRDYFGVRPGATDEMKAYWHDGPPAAGETTPAEPMLMQTASMDLLVKSYDRAETEVRRLTERHHGTITGGQTSKEDDRTSGTITVRVPAARLMTLMAEVGKLGEVKQKELTSEEVTEEFIDLQARLRNYQREEEQLLLLLKRTGKLSDVLAVERTLAEVRGRIEQVTGRLRYIENRVEQASLTITLEERSKTTAPVAHWSVLEVAKRATSGLLATLRTVAEAIIWSLIFIVIPLVVALITWWAIRRRLRQQASV